MPFRDPIVAGVRLVRTAIQSEDFAAGVAGWRIKRNGDAEFNDGTFRGTIEASIVRGSEVISDHPTEDKSIHLHEGELRFVKKTDNDVVYGNIDTLLGAQNLLRFATGEDSDGIILQVDQTGGAIILLEALGTGSEIELRNLGNVILLDAGAGSVDLQADNTFFRTAAGTLVGRARASAGNNLDIPELFRPYGRFYRDTTQSCLNNTDTKIPLNATNGTSTIGTRASGTITLTESGLFRFSWGIAWSANATGFRRGYIMLNGLEIAPDTTPAASGVATHLTGSIDTLASVNDTVELWGRQNSGGALSTLGGVFTGLSASWLTISKIGTDD
jgi:hypothetical protein